jgi:hypothetical protein
MNQAKDVSVQMLAGAERASQEKRNPGAYLPIKAEEGVPGCT